MLTRITEILQKHMEKRGIAVRWAGMNMDEAIRLTDEKLYSGKEAGRNRIVRE